MTGRARSRKEELAQLRERLHAQGWTYDRIADRIRAEHGVNSRVAYRLAHGLTQQQVADRWNELWPREDGPKTGKHISYWEAWPAPSGRTPTLATLGHLAAIYQCRPGDLLDHDDYPHIGAATTHRPFAHHDGTDILDRPDPLEDGLLSPEHAHLAPGAADGRVFTPLMTSGGSDEHGQTDDTDLVLRRTVIRALTLLGTATLTTTAGRIEPAFGSAIDWRDTVHEYGYTYLSTPRLQFLGEAAPDLGDLLHHLAQARDDREMRLLSAAGARLAALMALACTDLSFTREARHVWRLARALSNRAGDADTDMWVRGQEVVIGLYQRRPTAVLAGIARHPVDTSSSRASTGAVQLLAAHAQLHATVGHHEGARDALTQAERIFDRLPDAITANTDSAFGWPEQRLRHAESFIAAHTGPSRLDVHDRARALYGPARQISRCQVELHRALSIVRNRDPRVGVRHASETLAALATEHRRLFVLAVADDVLAAVPPNEHSQHYVHEYRDLLAATRMPAHA
jgi:hypothetical protein